MKATIVGEGLASAQASHPPGEDPWSATGALEPPYDPRQLAELFEHTSALRPNVDAYATNIDGFGYRFEPVLDFDSEDAPKKVADALRTERAYRGAPAGEPAGADVQAVVATLAHAARAERARLEAFVESCTFERSFVSLRRRTRIDLEVTGNAYWEVLRNARGQIARFVYVPACSVRLRPTEPQPVLVRERVRTSPIGLDELSVPRRVRQYVQVEGGPPVYFRALGDPRTVSRATGRVFADVAALRAADAADAPATEMIHFALHSPLSPYGVPRWIGALLCVMGSREQEEVNLSYFSNKSVPPLAILVSGGRVGGNAVATIERYLEENIKGKGGFHRALILESEGTGQGQGKITLQPLTAAQQQDGLFQAYDERNIDKVGATFRLPRILRGDSRDSNRATSESSLRTAEEQVFQPERDEFDHGMNQLLLNELGIQFWRMKSQAPVTRDPERMTEMIERLVRVGVLTPEEGRRLAGDVFNTEFRTLEADWTKRPITLTLAGIQNDGNGLGREPDVLVEAKRLLALRNELEAEEQRIAERRLAMARDHFAPPVEPAGMKDGAR